MAGRQWRQGPRVKGRQGIGKYEVKVMGQEKKKGIMAAGTLLALTLYAGTAWASDGRWEYNDVKNQWRYRDGEEGHVTGKRELDGETYFFDGDGVMLTGWVRCPKGEIPEPYSDAMDGEDIYYCGDDTGKNGIILTKRESLARMRRKTLTGNGIFLTRKALSWTAGFMTGGKGRRTVS